MNNILEDRISKLETALEKVLDCFDTSASPVTTYAIVDGEDTEVEIPIQTVYVIEEALNVLYGDESWQEDEE